MWRGSGQTCRSKETGPIDHNGEFRAAFVKAIKYHQLEVYYLKQPMEEKADAFSTKIPGEVEDEGHQNIDKYSNSEQLSYVIDNANDADLSSQSADLAESLLEMLDDKTRLVIEEVFYEFDGDASFETFEDIFSKYKDEEVFDSPKHAQNLYNEGINRLIIYTQEQDIES